MYLCNNDSEIKVNGTCMLIIPIIIPSTNIIQKCASQTLMQQAVCKVTSDLSYQEKVVTENRKWKYLSKLCAQLYLNIVHTHMQIYV